MAAPTDNSGNGGTVVGTTKASSVHAPRSTTFQSFSTTCKCVIGSGFLALPYAFSRSGWLAGILLLALMGARSYYTMVHILNAVHLTRVRLRRLHFEAHDATSNGLKPHSMNGYGSLQTREIDSPAAGRALTIVVPAATTRNNNECDAPDRSPTPEAADPAYDVISFQQIASTLWGSLGRKFVDVTLMAAQVGAGTAFLSFILSNLVAVFVSYGHDVSILIVAACLFPLLLALTMPRSTTYLASVSLFGNTTLLLAVGTIVFRAATAPESDFSWAMLSRIPAFASVRGAFMFLGLSAFSFTAHAEIVAVEADAQSREAYGRILPVALTSIVALYTSVSLFAYVAFGHDRIESNILLNLGDALLINIVRVTMSITLCVNYALAVFPASQALDLALIGRAPVSEIPRQKEPGDLFTPTASPIEPPTASPVGLESPDTDEEQALLGPDASHQPNGHVTRPPPPLTSQLSGSRMLRVSSSVAMPSVEQTEALRERNDALTRYKMKGNLIRLIMVTFTFFVAVAVQNLGLLISVVGAVFGGLLCYTLPPLFWFCLCRLESVPLSRTRVSVLIGEIALGLALVVVGLAVGVLSEEGE